MSPERIREVLLSILATIAPDADVDEIRPAVDLREELDIDSMDFLRFVVRIEERLGVSVPERDYPRVRTLDACVAYLAEKGATERAPAAHGP